MKHITDNYKDQKIEIEFTVTKNNTNELIDQNNKYMRDILMLINNKYSPLFIYNVQQSDNKIFNEFIIYVRRNYISPLLYKPVSFTFVPDYIFVHDISDYIDNKNDILLFNTDVNISEAILYYNTQKSKFNKVVYNIHNLYYLNKGDISEYDKHFLQLKKNYDGEKIEVDIGMENSVIPNKYKIIIDKYKNKKIDLVFVDYRKTNKVMLINSNELLDFSIMYITLNVLQQGGTYIFKLQNNNKYYIKDALTLVSKYFDKIMVHNKKIQDYDKEYYFICTNYKGKLDDHDDEILKDILDKWNKINPNGGIGLNYSHFDKYDAKSEYDDFASKLFSKHDSDISKYIDALYEHIILKRKRMNKLNKKYSDINNLTLDDLKIIYNKKNDINKNNVRFIADLYDMPLRNEYTKKAKLELSEITKLLVFEPPVHIALNNFIDKKTDPNSLIEINETKFNFNKLDNIKETLNLYKMGIDTRNLEKWEDVVYNLNISQQVMKTVRNKYQVNVTRAFVKMHEILTTYKSMIFDANNKKVTTMHICEAPGHFINATVYFMKKNYPNQEHNWYANSLNPNNKENLKKYGTLFKDEYGFIRKYPNRWLWGVDDTGDITNPKNVEFFKKSHEHTIDLFSSDCGLGSNLRYEFFTQEDWMSILNYSQILISLITLKLKGSAIYKFFVPFTKPLSISLLYMLSLYFEHLYIIKPTTSSPTNNEIYIVAINKKYHLTDSNYNKFIEYYENFTNNKNFFKNIDKLFIDEVYAASKLLVDQQIDQIAVIYNCYDKENWIKDNQNMIYNIKNKFADKWLDYFDFKNVSKNNFIN
jgi:cap2 methyltransferase